MTPTLGSIVHYRPDATQREAWSKLGNSVDPGELVAAVIVAVWSDECVNLRVMLDGEATPWVTSATLGEDEYQWRWPERVG